MKISKDEEFKILQIEQRLRGITKGKWSLEMLDGCPWIKAPRENPKHGYDIEVFGEDTTQYSTQLQDFKMAVSAPDDLKFLLRLILREKRLILRENSQ